jgi:hypothetical protein
VTPRTLAKAGISVRLLAVGQTAVPHAKVAKVAVRQAATKGMKPRISRMTRIKSGGVSIREIREIREIRGKKSFRNGVNPSYSSAKKKEIFSN